MKAFVTGATGFVGSHVAQLLAAEGAQLRLLVRKGSRQENLQGLNAELVTGDLTDPVSLRKGMEGCDAVFHLAADYRLWIPDPAPMYAANVNGTVAVIEAARATPTSAAPSTAPRSPPSASDTSASPSTKTLPSPSPT